MTNSPSVAAQHATGKLVKQASTTTMADAERDGGGLNRTLKDLFAGAMGGIAQVLIGQSSCFCRWSTKSAGAERSQTFFLFRPFLLWELSNSLDV